MNAMRPVLLAIACLAFASFAVAADPSPGMGPRKGMDMAKEMDLNGDGKITRDEFMQHHAAMFDRMKNKDGVILVEDLRRRHAEAMGHDGMKRDGMNHDGMKPGGT